MDLPEYQGVVTDFEPTGLDERLDAVQRLWATYRDDGLDPAIALLDPEVEWVDREGRSYSGHPGVRRFFDWFGSRGERFAASLFTFELHDPDLLAVGHHRISSQEGIRGDYTYFVHSVRDGRVCRISAHATREDALADIRRRAKG